VIVAGGKLIARQGLFMSTCDANRPGALRLRGQAAFFSETDSKYGINLWCGIWEIDGGRVKINVGDIEFWGDKFKDAINTKINSQVGAGQAVLKLTGEGISTIHARNINFVAATVLDVSGLKVSAGTYRLIDGVSIRGTGLRFTAGTNTNVWSFKFDKANGDLLLTVTP
jgi:hypothetical protein